MKLIAWMLGGALAFAGTVFGLIRLAYSFDRMARLERFEEFVTDEAKTWGITVA